MKAFVLKEPGVVGWHDAPEPKLTPYGAILEPVAVTPCSSDVHTVFGGGSRKAPNLVLGHECVGRIVGNRRAGGGFFPWRNCGGSCYHPRLESKKYSGGQ